MVAQQAIPSDALQTQVAIKKLETEKAAIQLHDDKIKAVDEVGAKLVGQDHFAKDDVQSKLDKLKTDRADLGTALDAKKKALEEAYTLQKFNSDQAEVLAWLGDKKATIAAAETAADLAGVNKQLKKHQELKAAVETHDERVNTVKAQGDKLVGDGHSASEEIKAKVEAVVAERAAVAEALSARDKQLAEALELAKFNEEAADELAWLHKNTDAAKNAELPSDIAGVQQALKKHADAHTQANTHDQKVEETKKFGGKLVEQSHTATPAIEAKVAELTADQKALHDALDERKKHLDEQLDLLKFEHDQKDAVGWLKEKNDQVTASEVPSDVAGVTAALKKLKDQRTAAVAHDDRVKAVQASGDALIAKPHPQADKVQAKLDELKGERESLTSSLDARQKQLDDVQALLHFNAAHGEALGWIEEIKEIVSSAETPKDVESAHTALREHNDRLAQIEAYDERIHAVKVEGEKLIAEGHPSSAEIQTKLDQLNAARDALKAAWDARKTLLEGVLDHLHFEESHREADTYVQDKHDEIKGFEVPKDLAAVHAALKQLAGIAANVAGQSDKLNKVQDHGATLVSAGHPQTESIQGKVDGLKANRAALDQAHADHKKALEDALKLLKFDNDHQEASDFLADKKDVLDNLERPKDESTARSQLKQLADLRSEVDAHDDKIKQVKADGDALVAADHPAKDDVDAKLKKLAEERAAFAAALAQKEKQIRQAVELMDFSADAQAAENFLKDKETQLAHPVTTDSVASADAALKKHQKTLNELNIEAAKIKALEAEADKLIKDDHFDKDAIDARRNDIVARYAKLTEEAEKRQKVQT